MSKFPDSSNFQDVVQSCITTISFPKTIDEVLDMVEKNQHFADWTADIDLLLNFKPNCDIMWSSPKWLTQGDILFFYYTKSSKQRTTKLLQEVIRKCNQEDEVVQARVRFLERTAKSSDLYSGTIFGCAEVSGSTKYLRSELCHFEHRFFAPLGEVHIFENPLSSERFAEFVQISQSTIRPLYGQQFEGIKRLLFKQNILPNFLQNAQFGERTFRNINKENWYSISCSPSTRFLHEAQIRAYLVDYLLNEIKDKNTPLLEECKCFRDGKLTGLTDYMMKLDDKWIPVEAKLNILTEKDPLSQLAKYTQIDSFIPTKGQHIGKTFKANKLPICLIVDQSGVYVILDNKFFKCNPGTPIWKREQLNHSTSLIISDWISNNCL
jgi:hypothetical protein